MVGIFGDPEKAAKETTNVGYAAGTGNLIDSFRPSKWDRSNNYENYMIQKGIDYAKERYKKENPSMVQPIHPFGITPAALPYIERTDKDINYGLPQIDWSKDR